MDMSTLVWLFVSVLCYHCGFFRYANCTTVHIYATTKPHSVLASVQHIGRTNFSFDTNLSDQDGLQLLFVEPLSGAVRLNYFPDCESLTKNPFVVFVRSFAVSKPSGEITRPLTVFVHGDDCIVKFRRQDLPYTIVNRDAHIGTRVFHLIDLFANNSSLKPTSLKLLNKEARKYFSIDSRSGHLRLRKPLSSTDSRILDITVRVFLVPASLIHTRSRKQAHLRQLRVFVDDRNSATAETRHRFRRSVRNNKPQFSNLQIVANVKENVKVGTTVTTISASDSDDGNNGVLSYSMSAQLNLQSNTLFKIDSSTGLITTRQLLDRESIDTHYFTVRATDHGNPPLSATASLTITVQDINDNSPVFESSSYVKEVPESILVGDTVLYVRARDKDAGSNRRIRYSIVNPGGVNLVFRIGELSGSITVAKKLDREKISQYSLQVKAEDQGTPVRSATANVQITLSDVNDCKPKFSPPSYSVNVREDIRRNSDIIKVSATDDDFGRNSQLTYAILHGNDKKLFTINSITGQIKVVGTLDYEAMPFYRLMISATDNGVPPLFSQTAVDISLIDVNDNTPSFVSPRFQAQIMENARTGSFVTHVQAFDHDDTSNKQIMYSLVRRDVPFTVDSKSGYITTTGKLDREKQSLYNFGVKATDKGNPPLSSIAQVSVTVTDINDNPPRFKKSVYYASVLESAQWSTSILKVSAKDPDQGPSNVFYSIDDSTNTKKCFRMLPSGTIVLSCRLDYNKDKHYILTVEASDGQLKSTAVVYVNVTDSNTHSPVFDPVFYNENVAEDVPIGYSVAKVTAKDEDTGINAKISFSFVKPVAHFAIDTATGEIKTAAILDRENENTYSFQVLAKDHGKPSLSATASVFISVTDVNDNAPQFTKPKYTVSIKEDFPVGKVVIEVSAVDDDSGKNKQIQYSLASKSI